MGIERRYITSTIMYKEDRLYFTFELEIKITD